MFFTAKYGRIREINLLFAKGASMGKRKKTLSLNIFSLISLLLAVVMIVFFCFPFLLGIPENQSMLTQQAIRGFDFLIYPFQKLFGGSSGNTLLISIELQNQANTLELLTGIFTDFSMLFAALYLILSILRVAGLIKAKRNTLPLMILISMIFLVAAMFCLLSLIFELKSIYSLTTQIYLPLIPSVLSAVFSLVRR